MSNIRINVGTKSYLQQNSKQFIEPPLRIWIMIGDRVAYQGETI